jgi:hypothetical protein
MYTGIDVTPGQRSATELTLQYETVRFTTLAVYPQL